jgi:hypothetical protein
VDGELDEAVGILIMGLSGYAKVLIRLVLGNVEFNCCFFPFVARFQHVHGILVLSLLVLSACLKLQEAAPCQIALSAMFD